MGLGPLEDNHRDDGDGDVNDGHDDNDGNGNDDNDDNNVNADIDDSDGNDENLYVFALKSFRHLLRLFLGFQY